MDDRICLPCRALGRRRGISAQQKPFPPRTPLGRKENSLVERIRRFQKCLARLAKMLAEQVQHDLSVRCPFAERLPNLWLHLLRGYGARHRDTEFPCRLIQFMNPVQVLSDSGRNSKDVATLGIKTLRNSLRVLGINVIDERANAFKPVLDIWLQKRRQAKRPIHSFLAPAVLLSKRYPQCHECREERSNCCPRIPVHAACIAEPPALTESIQHAHALLPRTVWGDSAMEASHA